MSPKEHDASSCEGYSAQGRVVALRPPLRLAAVGIRCIDPAGPVCDRVWLTEKFQRIVGHISHPEFAILDGFDFRISMQLHCGAPLGLATENKIGLRVEGHAIPFATAHCSW